MSAPKITDANFARALEVFKKVPFVQHVGLELLEMRKGEATVKLVMRDELRQPYGVLHGGATATLIDTATAFAVVSAIDESEKATTVDLTVHYLRPVQEGFVTCTAKVLRVGKRLINLTADVIDEEGKLVATALSTYSKF
jgi:acyl-CoA thioesterase